MRIITDKNVDQLTNLSKGSDIYNLTFMNKDNLENKNKSTRMIDNNRYNRVSQEASKQILMNKEKNTFEIKEDDIEDVFAKYDIQNIPKHTEPLIKYIK